MSLGGTPLLTEEGVLAALGCSEGELWARIQRGEVAAYRVGRALRFELDPVTPFVQPAPLPRRPRRSTRKDPSERFWAMVDFNGPASALGICWAWTGTTSGGGYGKFRLSYPVRRTVFAHRFAYEDKIGPIPEGLQIDHLCRHRGCVNPDHLEPVTARVNVLRGVAWAANLARQMYCKRGHPLFGDNVYSPPGRSPRRECRTCKREANRLRWLGRNRAKPERN